MLARLTRLWQALLGLSFGLIFVPVLLGVESAYGLAAVTALVALALAVVTERLAPDVADLWASIGAALEAAGRVLVDLGLAALFVTVAWWVMRAIGWA